MFESWVDIVGKEDLYLGRAIDVQVEEAKDKFDGFSHNSCKSVVRIRLRTGKDLGLQTGLLSSHLTRRWRQAVQSQYDVLIKALIC